MKLLLIAFIVISAVFASPKIDPWNNIDWDKVVPVQDLPGFWDNRDPALRPKSPSHGSRVVGGSVAIPHQFPYQAAVLVALPTGTGLCGGSVISNVSLNIYA